MADNVQVVVRTRPLLEREIKSGGQLMWKTKTGNTIQSSNAAPRPYSFVFDAVFSQDNSTSDVFEKVQPIISAAMNGFNGTIFAYGQTASGKTHTMMGNPDEVGVIPSAVQQIYDHIESSWDREFLVRVSYMELYNENVVDLLGDGKTHLDIREDTAGNVFVDKLEETVVRSTEEIMSLISRGEEKRHFGVTNMNERSSRSHTIFKVIIESKELEDTQNNHIIVSALNLVDLAGSEKAKQTGAVGQRLQEGGHINKSLSALSKVISQLSDVSAQNRHVSYRDSKLTRILQNSLGGNSKTAIICNCSPASFDETLSTLRFAMSAKRITNKPVVNEVLSNEAMIMRYKVEIGRLQKRLDKMKSMDVGCIQEENEELQQRLQQEEKVRHDQQQQIERLRQLICVSSRIKPTGLTPDFKGKSKRRETWCPGGRNKRMAGLKMLSLSPVFDSESCETSRLSDRRSDRHIQFAGVTKEAITEEDDTIDSVPSAFGTTMQERVEDNQELLALKDELRITQEAFQSTYDQFMQLQKEHSAVKSELTQLREYNLMEEERMLMEEKPASPINHNNGRDSGGNKSVNKTAERKRSDRDSQSAEVAELQALRDRDRQDAEFMMQDLMKEIALVKDHNNMLKAEMENINQRKKKLEADQTDFDILMEMEKAKFQRRENELKEQLSRVYAESGRGGPPEPVPVVPQNNVADELHNAQLQQLQDTIDQLTSELESKTEKVTEKVDGETQVESSIIPEETESQRHEEEVQAKDTVIQQLQQEIEGLKIELASATESKASEQQTDLKQYVTEIQSLKAELEQRSKDLSDMTTEMKDMEAQRTHIEQLTEQVQSLRAQLALQNELGGAGTEEGQSMSLADELAELTVGLTDMFPRRSLMKSPNYASQLESEAFDELRKDLEHRNTQLKENLAKLQEELASTQDELSDAENIIVRKESELADLEEIQKKLQIQHDDKVYEFESEIQELLRAMQELRQRDEEFESENNSLKTKLKEANNVKSDSNIADSTQFTEAIAALEKEKATILQEKDEIQQLLDVVFEEKEERSNEVVILQRKLEEIEKESSEKSEEITRLKEIQSNAEKLKEELNENRLKLSEVLAKGSQMDTNLVQKNLELEQVVGLQEMLDRNSQNEESLTRKISELQHSVDTLTERESSCLLQIQELEKLNKNYAEIEKQLREQEAESQKELDAKKQKLEDLLAQNNAFADQLNEVEREKVNLVGEIAQFKVLLEGISTQEDASMAKQRELEREVESLKQQLLDKDNDMFSRINELKHELDSVQSENIDLVANEQLLSKERETLQAALAEKEAELARLREEVTAHERCAADALIDRDLAQDELKRINEAAGADTDEQVKSLNGEVARLSEECRRQAQRMAKVEQELATATQSLEASREEVAKYEAMVAKGKQMLLRTQEDYDEISGECLELHDLNDQLSKQNEEVLAENEAMREKHELHLQEIQNLYQQHEEGWITERDQLSEEIETSKEKIKPLDSQIEKLENELREVRSELAGLQSANSTDSHELLDCRNILSKANEEILLLKEQLVTKDVRVASEMEKYWQDLRQLQQQYIQAQEDNERILRLPEVVREYQKDASGAEELFKKQLGELRATYEQRYAKLLEPADSDYQEETIDERFNRLRKLVACVTQQSQTIASEAATLRSQLASTKQELDDQKRESEAEEERLMKCCNEADEELEEMKLQRNSLKQQLDKLVAAQNASQNMVNSDVLDTLKAQNQDLSQQVDSLKEQLEAKDRVLDEQDQEARAEQLRLMTCCDEADAELEQMTKERNSLKQEMEKLRTSGADMAQLKVEKERLDKLNKEQQIELVKLKNDLLMATDPYRSKIRLLSKEIESYKEREVHLKNEIRKMGNNNPDDSFRPSRSCNLNGTSGVNAELMKCQLDMEKRRHEQETKYIRAENDTLKKSDKKLRDDVRELKRLLSEKDHQIQKYKEIYHKSLTADERHTLRDVANSPVPSLAKLRAKKTSGGGENKPPATPRRLKQLQNQQSNEGWSMASPNFNRTIRDEDFRICTPPDPSEDAQCAMQ